MKHSSTADGDDEDGAVASMRALWRRAPLWRFFLLVAALLTAVFALFPPYGSSNRGTAAVANNDTATYTPPTPKVDSPQGVATSNRPAEPTQTLSASKPKTAVLSMVTARPGASAGETGLDPALLGPLYRGSVTIDGYTILLPAGEWADLAHSTITLPTATGDAHFLGRIHNRRLVGAVRAFAVRSRDRPGAGFNEVKSCTETNPGRTFVSIDGEMTPNGHQACWTIRTVYATPWSKWADRAVKLSAIDRAAAGDMVAKGVTYPQDFISLTYTRTETWGLLEVMYLFSPENEGISSHSALSVTETDWTPTNIGQYPEKLAYIEKLKDWGTAFWPRFKVAFDQGEIPRR